MHPPLDYLFIYPFGQDNEFSFCLGWPVMGGKSNTIRPPLDPGPAAFGSSSLCLGS